MLLGRINAEDPRVEQRVQHYQENAEGGRERGSGPRLCLVPPAEDVEDRNDVDHKEHTHENVKCPPVLRVGHVLLNRIRAATGGLVLHIGAHLGQLATATPGL